MGRRILRWAAAAAITSMFVFSLLPLRSQATLHGTKGHSILHVTAFASAALISLFAAANQAQRFTAVLGFFLLAVSIEAGQCLVFHQRMEWEDVLYDCLGTLAALALISAGQLFAAKSGIDH